MQYQGSKARLSKYLAPIIQSYITSETSGYLEPFVGGANMIDKIECNNKLGYDISPTLIALLNKAKNDCIDIPDSLSEEDYYAIKKNPENYERWLVGLARYCGSFNGMFGGYAHDNVNKRNGKPKHYVKGAIKGLKKQSVNIQDTIFRCCNFQDVNPSSFKKAIIYCDPPYRKTHGYNASDFPHDGFYKWCEQMAENNTVLVSEIWMPEHFTCIWQQEIKIYHSQTTKQPRIEKLYTL